MSKTWCTSTGSLAGAGAGAAAAGAAKAAFGTFRGRAYAGKGPRETTFGPSAPVEILGVEYD